MTNQQAYQRVRFWFSRPNARYGMGMDEGCVYRAHTNANSLIKCAVGCLIPNNIYANIQTLHPDIEFLSLYDMSNLVPDLQEVDLEFLKKLQSMHDSCARQNRPMSFFIRRLDALARRYELVVSVT